MANGRSSVQWELNHCWANKNCIAASWMWKIFLCYSIYLYPCELTLEWVTLQLFVVGRTIYLWPAQLRTGCYTLHIPGLCNVMLQVEGVSFLLPIDLNHSNSKKTKELFFFPIGREFVTFSLGTQPLLILRWSSNKCTIRADGTSSERQRKNQCQFQTFLDKPLSPGFSVCSQAKKKIGPLVNVNPRNRWHVLPYCNVKVCHRHGTFNLQLHLLWRIMRFIIWEPADMCLWGFPTHLLLAGEINPDF